MVSTSCLPDIKKECKGSEEIQVGIRREWIRTEPMFFVCNFLVNFITFFICKFYDSQYFYLRYVPTEKLFKFLTTVIHANVPICVDCHVPSRQNMYANKRCICHKSEKRRFQVLFPARFALLNP